MINILRTVVTRKGIKVMASPELDVILSDFSFYPNLKDFRGENGQNLDKLLFFVSL
jgi:hypothetical protein